MVSKLPHFQINIICQKSSKNNTYNQICLTILLSSILFMVIFIMNPGRIDQKQNKIHHKWDKHPSHYRKSIVKPEEIDNILHYLDTKNISRTLRQIPQKPSPFITIKHPIKLHRLNNQPLLVLLGRFQLLPSQLSLLLLLLQLLFLFLLLFLRVLLILICLSPSSFLPLSSIFEQSSLLFFAFLLPRLHLNLYK
jgi:hypothetical protein